MDYLDLVSRLDTPDSEYAPEYDKNDLNDKTLDAVPNCDHRLCLPESKALGRCIRCQSEAEFVDTLARINIRRARTTRAVAARAKELEAS